MNPVNLATQRRADVPDSDALNISGDQAAGSGQKWGQKNMEQIWVRVRARLRAAMGEDVFTSWFARLELEEIVDDLAHLSVPTRFLCSWVQSHYASPILEAFSAENAKIKRLHFTVRVNGQARPRLVAQSEASAIPQVVQPSPKASAAANPPSAGRGNVLTGSIVDPKMTFDNFVPGMANEMALGVARQVASAAASNTVAYNPVYVHSSVGLGKSHLLNAIAWAAGAANSSLQIVYLTADHFMYHFIT
ncbi:MAG TPA: hypothetical protein ENJ90_06150, partial [Devosia sp.]|nr:hypothetical protein [Devosia sp.]